jgi:glycosyltransferase involved in cell wall biosynthesis
MASPLEKSMSGSRPVRVALVSVGLGRVQRGFERWASDLFKVLRDEVDIYLFKSGGPLGKREKRPALLRTATKVARILPLGSLAGASEYNRDCLAFGVCMIPDIIRLKFDVIHCVDPPMAVILRHLKRIFRFRARVLFTEGCVVPPEFYPPVDHVHHVAPQHMQNAVDRGIDPALMTLIPSGVHTERFADAGDRNDLREKFGIARSTFVVLAVSALRREHKRLDYLIEEASGLAGDVLLWIDGNPEDPTVPELARRKLGERCRITHVPSDQVPELYRVADVLVQASLRESFGLAIVEAIAAGTMILAHDVRHFEWLTGDRECLLDMTVPGLLRQKLREIQADREAYAAASQVRAQQVRLRFDWNTISAHYSAMYQHVANIAPTGALGKTP